MAKQLFLDGHVLLRTRGISIFCISTLLPLAYHGYHKPTLGCLPWVCDPSFCQRGVGHKPTVGRPMSLQKSKGHFSGEKTSLEQHRQTLKASKHMGTIFSEKNSLEQRSQTSGASRNLGSFFWGNILEHLSQKLKPSENLGPFFLRNTPALSNEVRS